ncbi:MAG: sugar ABC transporter permease [Spirochaetes bacterium]|nr:sugar ABC transporter permease [Spirochaetota bacterium]
MKPARSRSPTAGRRPARRSLRRRAAENATAWLFIGPAVALIGLFGLFPALFTTYVSLFKYRGKPEGRFVGLENYAELFGKNVLYLVAVAASITGMVLASWLIGRRRRYGPAALIAGLVLLAAGGVGLAVSLPYLAAQGDFEVFDSLRVTIWYSIGTVPVQLAAGMVLAVFLHRKMRGTQAFRVIYLMPYVAPTVASAAVFEQLFSLRPDAFANQVLKLFGAKPLHWLQEAEGLVPLLFGASALPAGAAGTVGAYWLKWAQGPSLALSAITIYSWWVFIGYYALIYMNGLSSIPRQLYEAAEVDGAGKVRSFFSITLPLLSPSTYFLSLLGIIGTFKAFTHIYVLRNAAAQGTADPISVLIFFTFFRKARMSYASTISLLLFAIVIGLTILQQRLAERRVTYGD